MHDDDNNTITKFSGSATTAVDSVFQVAKFGICPR